MIKILAIILSPIYILGYIFGFLLVPFWNGASNGMMALVEFERKRIAKAAQRLTTTLVSKIKDKSLE